MISSTVLALLSGLTYPATLPVALTTTAPSQQVMEVAKKKKKVAKKSKKAKVAKK